MTSMDRIALSLYRPAQPDRLFLLAADVDGTLLGDTAGELSLMAYARRFPRSFQLAVITGRRPASVRELVDAGRLPRPDFICGAVGTELLDCRGGANTLGGRYDAQVPVNWDVEIMTIMFLFSVKEFLIKKSLPYSGILSQI